MGVLEYFFERGKEVKEVKPELPKPIKVLDKSGKVIKIINKDKK